MQTGNIVKSLQEFGFALKVQNGKIAVSFPGKDPPATAAPLLEKLRQYKSEVIEYLQNKQSIDFAVEATKVRAHLQRHGLAKIRSDTLGEDVFFVIDDEAAEKLPRGATVYTLDELRELIRGPLTGENLRQIHQVKKVFNGKVIKCEGS